MQLNDMIDNRTDNMSHITLGLLFVFNCVDWKTTSLGKYAVVPKCFGTPAGLQYNKQP